MPRLHFLGTGSAHTTADRTTTMLAVEEQGSTIVIDCGGDVVHRLLSAGVTTDSIDALVVTHEHPDHVGGFPLLMEKLWLSGRQRSLHVYGIRSAVRQAARCWDVFDTSRWTGVPEIIWHEVDHKERAAVLDNDHVEITASPGVHGAPVVGLRVESRTTGKSMVYSCDTEPCESIARLSNRADVLVHEANGASPGHTSITQAAEVARDAGAGKLFLVHLPVEISTSELSAARRIFAELELAHDLDTVDF